MSHVIFVNGPPRSGKDTVADILCSLSPKVTKLKLANILKDDTHIRYGLSNIDPNYYEDTKDIPQKEFNGQTPRQAYIDHSENYIKPKYGNDYLGIQLIPQIRNCQIAVIADSGFKSEALPIINMFSHTLIKLTRYGCNFDNDSRSYWMEEFIQIDNNSSLSILKAKLKIVLDSL